VTEPLSWHQQQALRRHYELRKEPAHILCGDYIFTGKALCGVKDPKVYISTVHRDKPINNCCKRCKAIADAGKVLSL